MSKSLRAPVTHPSRLFDVLFSRQRLASGRASDDCRHRYTRLYLSTDVLINRWPRYVLSALPMKRTIVVPLPGKVHRFHLQYRINPTIAKQSAIQLCIVLQRAVLTVNKWMRSWLGWTGGAVSCRLVSVRKTTLNCTSLRKLIRSYSRRSCNATWSEIISLRCTPLETHQ